MADFGYVKLHRTVFSTAVFKAPFEAMAFMYLVAKAAHAPIKVRYKGSTINLKRGQVAISVRDLAADMGRDRSWADRFLKRLRSEHMVSSNRDSGETVGETVPNVLTICNYDKYQALTLVGETASEQQPRQHRDSTETQNNKDKELKKERTTPTPSFELPDWVPLDEWRGWLEMRKGKRVPNTPRALTLALSALSKHRADGQDPAAMLDMATMKGWTSVYPVKGAGKQQGLTL